MGNAPSADLQGTESQRRVVEVMETKDEKSQGFKELATTNSKSKDDGSSIPNPLHSHSEGNRELTSVWRGVFT